MRNRAKCKLCGSIIESKHERDFVSCKCGEISIDGGESLYKASAIDFNNFLRVDDEGNEIVVTVKGEDNVKPLYSSKPTRKELIEMLDEMVKNIEKLPQQAMNTPVTHSDFVSLMLLLSAIFGSEEDKS